MVPPATQLIATSNGTLIAPMVTSPIQTPNGGTGTGLCS